MLPGVAAAQLTSADLFAREPAAPDYRVSYGPDSLQFGDLRLPDGHGPHPVAVVIHGGCWLSFATLEYLDGFCEALTSAGLATWSLEYRRVDSPGGGWPNTLLDVGRGVDYLRELAAEYALDLANVVVVGHSSGGHLALWVAGRHVIDEDSALHVSDPLAVQGAVCLSAHGDLEALRPRAPEVCGSDVVAALTGGPPEEVPSRYEAASPLRMLPLGVAQHLLIGALDETVPLASVQAYVDAARAAGDQVACDTLAAASHFEPIAPESSAWPVVRDSILKLLGR
jgi:acetyl esterase/lipase